ncbi:glycoside hydrolase family 1 protein [Aplosporella prunicola CBS 121167]|uniref:Glycoside hydrolase family 1 protein n=1 Tax=Aplosporella prunicola CBS 121167 TaxID=1176127 RepID=A0A6A6B9U1_9PEZI|nr:glycoside hydrolase family 1 protein [Aplosporella prunicola CBS 121167]KAF2140338.1 glycoside hydrolase family 1 protein [Aplosporella prunicola CBS 121167]
MHYPPLSVLLALTAIASAQSSASHGLQYCTPADYATKTYNASNLSFTSRPNNDYSDQALAFLWNQVGPVSVGPVTTTVSPTAEPSTYPQPGAYHGLVPSYDNNLTDAKLPAGFKWGVSSSSYQIEGAAKDEGKGPSIWDLLSHRYTNFVSDNTTGDVLASHYWLYKQDIARLKGLGVPAFSPSFSWPRIFPFGKGPVNEAGVKHYDDVIAELVNAGIEPAITLFHWDTPLALFNEYGAWTSPQIVDDFFNYAKFIISRYDEYVPTWFTINEPQYCDWQYSLYPAGEYYPAYNNFTGGLPTRFICGHYTLLAHAKVAKWYHEEFKGKGKITFKNSGNYFEANSSSEADKIATQRNYDFVLGWFGGPWTDGDYPQSLKEILGDILPSFTPEEKELVKGSCDFYAIDGYSAYYAYEVEGGLDACISNSSNPSWPLCAESVSTAPNGFPIGPAADSGVSWLYDGPMGIRRFLNRIVKDLFPSVNEIMVSEFGFAEPFEAQLTDINQVLWDLRRADYIQSYLDSILAAIVYDGVNVTGAWGWAIFDNFEWLSGLSTRFGLQYVNYTDLSRRPKASISRPPAASPPSANKRPRSSPKRRRHTMRFGNEAPSPSRAFSNGSNGFSRKVANGDGYTTPENAGPSANGTRQPTEVTFFGHDREEVTRILIQGLADLGYNTAAEALSQESGYDLEGPTVAAFRDAVLQGDWAKAESLLFGTAYEDGGGVGIGDGAYGYRKTPDRSDTRGLPLAEGADKDEMRFAMRQQKYLELLEGRDLGAALMVLRQELTPLHHDVNRLHYLSSLMMCDSAEDVRYQAQWDGAEGGSRNQLLSELSRSISPNIMIPEHRLAVLLDQVKQNWISNCLYHNTAVSPSLYLDHMCERDNFPLKTALELRHHIDEVWFLRFSNDGTMLATTGKDQRINVYDTNNYQRRFTLEDHENGVCYLAWSPDDTRLVSCSQDNSARLWDMTTGELLKSLDQAFDYPVTSAAWAPNGETFVTGSQDTAAGLCQWTVNGDKVHTWKEDGSERERGYAMRVHDVGISPDGQRLVVLLDHHIMVYDFITRERICEFEMQDVKLTSLSISQDSQRMLVSMNESKICLMDIDSGELLQRYEGQKQTQFIIRSTFGGAREAFVVSGSEDSKVYVWRSNGHLVEALEAHRTGCVNSVAWHPKDPNIFASAGDDRTVRMYVLPCCLCISS